MKAHAAELPIFKIIIESLYRSKKWEWNTEIYNNSFKKLGTQFLTK
jgi:hypothetical protein